MGPMRASDLRRLAAKGLDPKLKLILLSQMLFPRLCSIVGRGLTLEEISLLSGLDEIAVKRALKTPEIAKVTPIRPGKADSKSFVKVMVPLKRTIHADEGETRERPVKEPLLARRKLVEQVQRDGYVTREGRVLRHDYLSLVSGPMPIVYTFQGIIETVETEFDGGWSKGTKRRMAQDQAFLKAELEAAVAVLRFLAPLFQSEYAPVIAENLAAFFRATYESAIHYASRHRALNDQATFDMIEDLALPLIASAGGLEMSEWIKDEGMRESVAKAMDKVLEEFEAVVEGRAVLMPGTSSEFIGSFTTESYGH